MRSRWLRPGLQYAPAGRRLDGTAGLTAYQESSVNRNTLFTLGLTAAVLGGLIACKRQPLKMPTAATAPRAPGPTATQLSKERDDILRAKLDPIPDLGNGVVH